MDLVRKDIPQCTRKNLGITWLFAPPLEDWKGMIHLEQLQAPTKINPYYLPWIVARLSLDPLIKSSAELSEDLEQLRVLFLGWSPTDSALKELKYRLEPLKSKL